MRHLRGILVIFTIALCAGLAVSACEQRTTDTGSSRSLATSEPWLVVDVQPNTEDGVRILLMHDMEGLSGQDDPKTFDFGNDEYALGQDLLVGDVNAVVDGLFAGGATEVHVVDGHGSGNPEPDVPSDRLDGRAVQVLRDESFDAYVDLVEPGAYDAVALVGMHAKTGSGGFASHTYTLGIDFIVNGRSVTETEFVALSWGRVGIPVIFVSGDDRLAGDLETMPWIEYTTVKEATSASTANTRPLEEARAELREAAQRAVENLRDAKVMQAVTPIKATLRAVPPASLERLERFPGIEYADNRVTFVASDIGDAYEGFQGIVRVATAGYYSVLFEELRARGEMEEVWATWTEALMTRWFDVESGRWHPEEEGAEPPAERKYHGFQ
jgi:D-amino peptidase